MIFRDVGCVFRSLYLGVELQLGQQFCCVRRTSCCPLREARTVVVGNSARYDREAGEELCLNVTEVVGLRIINNLVCSSVCTIGD